MNDSLVGTQFTLLRRLITPSGRDIPLEHSTNYHGNLRKLTVVKHN